MEGTEEDERRISGSDIQTVTFKDVKLAFKPLHKNRWINVVKIHAREFPRRVILLNILEHDHWLSVLKRSVADTQDTYYEIMSMALTQQVILNKIARSGNNVMTTYQHEIDVRMHELSFFSLSYKEMKEQVFSKIISGTDRKRGMRFKNSAEIMNEYTRIRIIWEELVVLKYLLYMQKLDGSKARRKRDQYDHAIIIFMDNNLEFSMAPRVPEEEEEEIFRLPRSINTNIYEH